MGCTLTLSDCEWKKKVNQLYSVVSNRSYTFNGMKSILYELCKSLGLDQGEWLEDINLKDKSAYR